MSDIRDILDQLESLNEELEMNDSFDIELNEEIIIESGIVGFKDDGIIIEGTEDIIKALLSEGYALEEEVNPDENFSEWEEVAKGLGLEVEFNEEENRYYAVNSEGLQHGIWDVNAGQGWMMEINQDEQVNESTTSGSISSVSAPIGGMNKRNSIFAGISTSKPFYENEETDTLKDKEDYLHKRKVLQKMQMNPSIVKDKSLVAAVIQRKLKMDREALRKGFIKDLAEAEYQGRKVPLNKPMKGDVKKSKVYVKKPNGKVVKVNFGDKNMRIKKSNPNRRKSFRARHRCENPGPKWKARYWSCRAW